MANVQADFQKCPVCATPIQSKGIAECQKCRYPLREKKPQNLPAVQGKFLTKIVIAFSVFPIMIYVIRALVILPITLLLMPFEKQIASHLSTIFGAVDILAYVIALPAAFKICRNAWPKEDGA